MRIETDRLIIRSVECGDEVFYADMAKDGSIVGAVGCSYYDDLKQTGITYFIGKKYRRNGYAVEAIQAYTDYFFAHYQIKKLIATIREENIASWKTLEKTAFRLVDKKMYQDINDAKEELYRFYEI